MELTVAEKYILVDLLEWASESTTFPESHDLKNALEKIKKIEPKHPKT